MDQKTNPPAVLAHLHIGDRTGTTVVCTCGIMFSGDTPDDALYLHANHAEENADTSAPADIIQTAITAGVTPWSRVPEVLDRIAVLALELTRLRDYLEGLDGLDPAEDPTDEDGLIPPGRLIGIANGGSFSPIFLYLWEFPAGDQIIMAHGGYKRGGRWYVGERESVRVASKLTESEWRDVRWAKPHGREPIQGDPEQGLTGDLAPENLIQIDGIGYKLS